MSTRDFQTEIFLHIYNLQQTEVISGFLIPFYYTQIMCYSEFIPFPNTYSNFFLTIMMTQL